jgi:1,4-dihydroxy-2-naphthoyl-CoA synthase
MRLERELTVAVGMTDDAAEGQRAFVEKRPPVFSEGADWIAAEVERRRREAGG